MSGASKTFFQIIVLSLPLFLKAQPPVIDSLIAVLSATQEDTIKINTYNKLFFQYEFLNEEKAREYANKALQLSDQIGYASGMANAYRALGYLADDKGNYQEALKQHLLALKKHESIGDKKGVAIAHNDLGLVYNSLGNYDQALISFFTSLKTHEENKDSLRIASCRNNIGNVYSAQDNNSEALKNYSISLKIYKKMGDEISIADSYNNIGLVYYQMNNRTEAQKNNVEALKIRTRLNDKRGMATSYNNIGLIYSDENKYTEALKSFYESLKLWEDLGDNSGIGDEHCNIGVTHLKQKNYKEAEKELLIAKKMLQGSGHKPFLKKMYNALNRLYDQKGDLPKAYESYKQYILYRDSLDNAETKRRITQSQMTFDFEKKEAVAKAEHKKELEHQRLLAEEKTRKQKIIIAAVTVGFLLVLLFAGLILRSLRLTRKQKAIIEEQKKETEYQKLIIEEKNKGITDSITYAKRIQTSLLPTEKYIDRQLKRLGIDR